MEILLFIGFLLIFLGSFVGTLGFIEGEGAMAFAGLMGLVLGFILVFLA